MITLFGILVVFKHLFNDKVKSTFNIFISLLIQSVSISVSGITNQLGPVVNLRLDPHPNLLHIGVGSNAAV